MRGTLNRLGLDDWRVAVQVPLSALVDRRKAANGRGIPGWRLDYVIADAQRSTQGVIELNDASHARDDRRRRDEQLAAGLDRLGILLLVVGNGDAAGLALWLQTLGSGGWGDGRGSVRTAVAAVGRATVVDPVAVGYRKRVRECAPLPGGRDRDC